ncbi:ORF54 [Leucania separata nucleopolyhedrovirus]|uniref:ORF54 n=1 Tax=Leucania separata nucleopolyhedrovirus TaxID=1307956 RepID=Q0IL65_NPVLS|nr:ORF54 [Leucania separata nucleopolyhedrovirus]AAR28818.1 ORF54 [Leucania separata nucleopolyhedrovirus]
MHTYLKFLVIILIMLLIILIVNMILCSRHVNEEEEKEEEQKEEHNPCAGINMGFVPDPNDCARYFMCFNNNITHYTCFSGMLFSPPRGTCLPADEVDCGDRPRH